MHYEFLPGTSPMRADHVHVDSVFRGEELANALLSNGSCPSDLREMLAQHVPWTRPSVLTPPEFVRAFASALVNGYLKVRRVSIPWSTTAVAAEAKPSAPPPPPPPGIEGINISPLTPPTLPELELPSLSGPTLPTVPSLAELIPPNPLDKLTELLEAIEAVKAEFEDVRPDLDLALVQIQSFKVNFDFVVVALSDVPPSLSAIATSMTEAAQKASKMMADL